MYYKGPNWLTKTVTPGISAVCCFINYIVHTYLLFIGLPFVFYLDLVRVQFRRYWCDWPDTVENRRREEFCYYMESYFEDVCRCEYQLLNYLCSVYKGYSLERVSYWNLIIAELCCVYVRVCVCACVRACVHTTVSDTYVQKWSW